MPKFSPYGEKRMHAREGLACRKRVAAASSPAATCKQGAAAPGLVTHASVTEVVQFCPMDPKLRCTAEYRYLDEIRW